MKQHKIPERMCVACRQMHLKSELLRIVNTEGGVVIDQAGKLGGRGVYVCNSKQCIERTLKNKGFAKANGFALTDEVRTQLAEMANGQD